MLPRIDAGLAPVTPVRQIAGIEPIGDPRQEQFERSLQTLLGKSLSGQVLSRLTDGSFIVKVNGTPARMQLPGGAQVGADVPLTLVSLTPRPTFQIAGFGGAAAMMSEADAGMLAPPRGQAEGEAAPAAQSTSQSAARAAGGAGAANLKNNAALVQADALPGLAPDGREATLSPGARVITSVLATAMATPNPPTQVHGAAPLLARPPDQAATPALAGELKHAIDSSGLFYESHLREWSEGKRPLADLAREPQMQKVLDNVPPRAGAGAAIDGPTAQFINLQLSSHEQSRVAWQGELFPGQPMHWEISKDAPERQRQDGPEVPTAWRSAVRFRFAHLGEVNAQIVMVGDQLHLQVRAASVESGTALQAHAPRLSTALEAAGSPLASLNIAADA